MDFIYKKIEFNEQVISRKTNKKEFEFEQYGGGGIGFNGGGARCGNFKGLQYKGIGVMPVVGDHNNLYHSNGQYPLYEAVVEALCSQVYHLVLPLGTVKYLAILDNGVSEHYFTAEEPEKKHLGETHLAIGVREIANRPAFCLRAGNFKPLPEYRLLVPSDTYRTSEYNKLLRKKLGGDDCYIQYIGRFLSGCAQQFSFSKLFRISHGAVTPSNLSFDGRWLDLTNTTFVPGGDNYYAGKPDMLFLSEAEIIPRIVEELVYTYAKYNEIELNVKPLLRYYAKQFNAYFEFYIPEILGIPAISCDINLLLPAKRCLASWFNKHLHQSLPKGGVPRKEKVNDPTVNEIETILVNIFSLQNSGCKPEKLAAIDAARSIVLKTNQLEKKYPLKNYIMAISIRSLRKLYFSPLFYIGRIYNESRAIVNEQAKAKIQPFIDTYAQTAGWLFDKSDTDRKIVVFQSPKINVKYDMCTDNFIIIDEVSSPLNLSFTDWNTWIDSANLNLLDHDCRPWLKRMEGILRTSRINVNKYLIDQNGSL